MMFWFLMFQKQLAVARQKIVEVENIREHLADILK
jgi:hypothetical protein